MLHNCITMHGAQSIKFTNWRNVPHDYELISYYSYSCWRELGVAYAWAVLPKRGNGTLKLTFTEMGLRNQESVCGLMKPKTTFINWPRKLAVSNCEVKSCQVDRASVSAD